MAAEPFVDLASDAWFLRTCMGYEQDGGGTGCPFLLDAEGKFYMRVMACTIGLGVLSDMLSAYYRHEIQDGYYFEDSETGEEISSVDVKEAMAKKARIGMVVILIEDVSQLWLTYDIEYNIKPAELMECGLPAGDTTPSSVAEISMTVTIAMMVMRMLVACNSWRINNAFLGD